MPVTPTPASPCEKCGRPVALTAKRCIYCGTFRYKTAPGTPEREAEEATAREDEKRLKQQAALYRAGVGMPKEAQAPDRTLGAVIKVVLMLFVNPFSAFKQLRGIFRP
jgi:hypothetical protein